MEVVFYFVKNRYRHKGWARLLGIIKDIRFDRSVKMLINDGYLGIEFVFYFLWIRHPFK